MIARGFILANSRVYILSRDLNSLSSTADELNKLALGTCIPLQCDLQKIDDIKRVTKELEQREKCVHVLVNNAGANWGEEFDTYPDQAFNKVLTLNLQRVFTLTQSLLPLLLSSLSPSPTSEDGPWSDPARIINIGSVDGIRVPRLETYAYSASKAALHQLSRVLAAQLGRRGVTSNTIACGPFESKMMKATLEASRDLIVGGVPLARIGTPDDVAGTCLFLSSKAGAWVNGATIALDGGSLVGGKL
ncbi:NAD(P)-binding protein [Meredithblackwellia eburnea MCA 4105]